MDYMAAYFIWLLISYEPVRLQKSYGSFCHMNQSLGIISQLLLNESVSLRDHMSEYFIFTIYSYLFNMNQS